MTLKIDTTDREKIEVSLIRDGELIDEMEDNNRFGSQVLLPTITKLLKKYDMDFKDITDIELNPGPGSFTGIRVGASVVNALAYSLNIPVNGKKLETDLKY